MTPWTIALQAPLSMGFPRQEYWSRLPFPPPGDFPNPEIEPVPAASPASAGRFFTAEPPGKPIRYTIYLQKGFREICGGKKKKKQEKTESLKLN